MFSLNKNLIKLCLGIQEKSLSNAFYQQNIPLQEIIQYQQLNQHQNWLGIGWEIGQEY